MNITPQSKAPLMTEFLILPDGKVLVQDLTRVMAEILIGLNPNEDAIRRRLVKKTATRKKP